MKNDDILAIMNGIAVISQAEAVISMIISENFDEFNDEIKIAWLEHIDATENVVSELADYILPTCSKMN